MKRLLRSLGLGVAALLATASIVYATDQFFDEDVEFTKENLHVIYVATSTTATTAGGNLTMLAGEGSSGAAGGYASIFGGAWGGGNAIGGGVNIGAGAGSTGGTVLLQGGPGGANGGGSGHGGPIVAEGGDAHANTNGNGGDITLDAGRKVGNGNEGKVIFKAGGNERLTVHGSAISTNQSAVNIRWYDGSMDRTPVIEVGASNSCGSGYRCLRVGN